jgi:hypothetical protein
MKCFVVCVCFGICIGISNDRGDVNLGKISSEAYLMTRSVSSNGFQHPVARQLYRLLVGKSEGMRPLGRPRCRWIDDNKMDLSEIGLGVVDWIGLAQDRYRWRALVNAVMNLRVPENAGKLSSGCATCGLSSGTHLHKVS